MRRMLWSAVTGIALFGNAQAKTFVVPHILERPGLVGQAASTSDTALEIVYTGSSSASVDVYLYDNSGQLMRGASGASVCNACSYFFNANARQQTIRVEDAILAAGGFDTPLKQGFAVLAVSGPDPDGLKIEGKLMASSANPKDLSVAAIPLRALYSDTAEPAKIIPYFLEAGAAAATTAHAFDSTFFLTYAAGLAGNPSGPGANVDIYLYNAAGSPLRAVNGDVCNPCTFALTDQNRKQTVRIEDLITAQGGFPRAGQIESGFAMVAVGGADPASVSMGELIENSHASPSDLGLTWVEPVTVGGESGTCVIPYFTERAGKTDATPRASDTSILLTYASGLAGTAPGTGATVELYLYAEGGLQPLKGADGTAICAPCTFELDPANRRQNILLDDLIALHGFPNSAVNGHALIQVNGADPRGVNVQALFINSLGSTSDLSIHAFAPVEISRPAFADAQRATLVAPHLSETSGLIASAPHATDETLHFFYAGGLAGVPSGRVALNVYLFDGPLPLKGDNGAACMPCSYSLNSAGRYVSLPIETILGGVSRLNPLAQPYALIDARGDVKNLAAQDTVVNARASALDASIFGSEIPMDPIRLVIPKINSAIFANGLVHVFFDSEAGVNYRLESRALGDSEWDALDEITGTGEQQIMGGEPETSTQLFRLVAL